MSDAANWERRRPAGLSPTPIEAGGTPALPVKLAVKLPVELPVKLPDQIFVTGTDTGIGKTLISAILTIGLKAHYWKPIQSGTIDGTDSEWIQSVSKLSKDLFISEVYSLKQPLSPHAAAQLDGIEIDLDAVNKPDVTPLIVEGAGGIMVPLNKNQYMLDLMQRLSLPIIVVARSGLGTINHTLLTLNTLRAHGIEILGVVMNGTINRSNREALEHFGEINVLAEIPQLDSITNESLQMLFDQHFAHYFFEPSKDQISTEQNTSLPADAKPRSAAIIAALAKPAGRYCWRTHSNARSRGDACVALARSTKNRATHASPLQSIAVKMSSPAVSGSRRSQDPSLEVLHV